MLDAAGRANIEALGPDVWRQQLALGGQSSYNEAKRAYMRALLVQHEAHDEASRQSAQLELAAEANEIARGAATTAGRSLGWSVVAAIAAVVAAVISIVAYLRPPATP